MIRNPLLTVVGSPLLILLSASSGWAAGEDRREDALQAREEYFASFYTPERLEDIVRARYAFLAEHGSYEPLRSHGREVAALPTWEALGPLGKHDFCRAGNPIQAGRVIAFERDFSDENVLFAGGASGGLWRSTNGGLSWSNIFDDLAHPSVGAIASHPLKPGHVWIGTGHKGNGSWGPGAPSMGLLYRSEDGGNSWTPVNFAGTDFVNWVSKIVFIPQLANQDVVFVATNRGLYKSSTYGTMWEPVLARHPTGYSDLGFYGSVLGSSYTLVAAEHSGDGLERSTTGGAPGSWSPVSLPGVTLPLGRMTLAHSRLSVHDTFYANVAQQDGDWEGIWRSDDAGATWTEVNLPVTGAKQMNYNNTIAVDMANPNRVYTGANTRAVYRSADGGSTWTPSAGLHEDHHDLLVDGTTIFVVNDGGVFKSTDRAASFSDLGNEFLTVSQIYFLEVTDDPSELLYGGARYYIGTQDMGINRGPTEFLQWQVLTCCDGGDIAFKDGIAYSTITGLSSTGTHRYQFPPSGDVCAGWSDFTTGLPAGQPWVNRLIYDGADFYTNFGTGLYRAAGGLLPWDLVRTFSGAIDDLGVAPEGFVVLGAGPAAVWISDPTRTVWSQPTNPETFWQGRRVTAVDFGRASAPGRRVFLTLSGTTGRRVVMSESSGSTFADITGDLPSLVNARSLLVDPTDDRMLYLGSDVGIYLSRDGGAHWQPHSAGLPAVTYVNDIEYDGVIGKIVIGTYGRGVFMSDAVEPVLFRDGFESGDTGAWSP